MPSGRGRHHVRLSRLHLRVGQILERKDAGVSSNGQEPLRAGVGCRERVVPTQSAPVRARPTCPPVRNDARPLCLLRHIGQSSTHPMVRVAGCAGVEEMAGATGSPRRVPMEPPHCSPEATSSPTGSDRPSLCPCHEPSSPVRNRMREICTSGSVRVAPCKCVDLRRLKWRPR